MLYWERLLVNSLEGWNQTLQTFQKKLAENIDADGKITILVTNTYRNQETKWLMAAILVFNFRPISEQHKPSMHANRTV